MQTTINHSFIILCAQSVWQQLYKYTLTHKTGWVHLKWSVIYICSAGNPELTTKQQQKNDGKWDSCKESLYGLLKISAPTGKLSPIHSTESKGYMSQPWWNKINTDSLDEWFKLLFAQTGTFDTLPLVQTALYLTGWMCSWVWFLGLLILVAQSRWAEVEVYNQFCVCLFENESWKKLVSWFPWNSVERRTNFSADPNPFLSHFDNQDWWRIHSCPLIWFSLNLTALCDPLIVFS